MKIVLVGPAKPYRGGIAQFTDELARNMAHRGHEVTIETFRRQYPSALFPGTSQFEGSARVFPPGTEANLDSINPFTWIAAGRRIRSMRPDAVLFSYWLSFFAPAFACIAWLLRRHSIPVGAVVHNALPHEGRPGDRLLGRLFFSRCDVLITLSSAVSEDLRLLGVETSIMEAGHPVYTHFGSAIEPEEARRALGLDPGAAVLLFFGFIRRYKGLDLLIDALPEIVAHHPDAVLLVAGEFYEEEEKIRRRIAEYRLVDHVRFDTRYIPDERVATYFSAADLVVQPYRSATQSGVAHTAFHFGRPVVVTDVGGLSETVPHGVAGLVVPPEDPHAIAQAANRFFDERQLRERLEAGARRQHGVFSWDDLSERVETVARRLSAHND